MGEPRVARNRRPTHCSSLLLTTGGGGTTEMWPLSKFTRRLRHNCMTRKTLPEAETEEQSHQSSLPVLTS